MPREPADAKGRRYLAEGRLTVDRVGAGKVVATCRGELPQLLDARHLAAELGVTRSAAEQIMRQVPSVQVEGLRKVYARREDVLAYLESRTFGKDQVPA